jgi:uncharacterized repeat protein (TIGR01451 family)
MKSNYLILVILFFAIAVSGQGFQKIYAEDSLNVNSMCPDNKGGYFLFGTYFSVGTNFSHRLVNIDKDGNKKWKKDYADMFTSNLGSLTMVQLPDGSPLLYGHTSSSEEVKLIKLNEKGDIAWSLNVPIWWGGVVVADSSFYLYGPSRNGATNAILRFNLDGNVIGQTPVITPHISGYIIESEGVTYNEAFDYNITHIDFQGQKKWRFDLPLDFHKNGNVQITKAKDSTYFANTDTHLLKLDKNGKKLWIKPLPYLVGTQVLDSDDNLLFFKKSNGDKKHVLFKLNKNGTLLWTREYETEKGGQLVRILKLPNNGFMLLGQIYFWESLLIKTDSIGLVYTNIVQGKVTKDLDKNCATSNGDVACKNCIVEADRGNGEIYRSITNEKGEYFLNVDSGNYTLKAYPLISSANWQICNPSLLTTLKLSKQNETINFYIKPIVYTPTMEVNISTPLLRRCFSNTYAINYANIGSRKADSASIVVTLDSLLEYESASLPLTSRNGRKYSFNLGNVESEQYGSFNISTRVRCGDSTRIGQTICVDAKIFPDTVTSNSNWSGANIDVVGFCKGDSIVFQAKNTGIAASSLLNVYIIENDTYRIKRTIRLLINGVYTEKLFNTGNTWRMIVDQEPNHPTSTNPTAFVENCNSSLSVRNSNFVTKFAADDKSLSIDVDCQPIIGSYDPNDKTGYPTGYGKQFKINQNQDIEYKIRFQNTGTDTAFTVVVRDTLTENLDISSIEFGASSHPYKAQITEKRLLTFTFNNINLVDSFKNEPKSQGFVNFRIRQNKDLAFGKKITNSVGIYFDFNDPVVTNTTIHTVSAIEIVSAISEKPMNYLNINVYPNPIIESSNFELPLSIEGIFELFDTQGILLFKDSFQGNKYTFQRNNIAPNMYFFKITHKGQIISTGKLLIL